MATSEERLEVLKRIEAREITAEEGAKLLEALDAGVCASESPVAPPPASLSGRWFRVRVTDLKTGKKKVSVNVPLALAELALRMGARFGRTELIGPDIARIVAALQADSQGKILDVEDEEGGEHVEIFVE
ncbi:MAG: DUF2089 domain-containing protein [Planctomycetes bacterium]|nr:DUF2089 domain-containing protein [Planctomycetota bacterium]